jgi:outer membrane protein TolC
MAAEVEIVRNDIERSSRLLGVAEALESAGTRSGVERALAAAELGLAEQRLARSEGQAAAAQARLALALGEAKGPVALAEPPAVPPPAVVQGRHPSVRVQGANVEELEHRLRAARAGLAPRLELAAAGWLRSGQWPAGADREFAPNWAVGAVVELPVLDLVARSADIRAAEADRDEALARLRDVELEITGQVNESEALLHAARQAAAQSEAVVRAAEEAREQAMARFEAGLIDVTLVATTQSRAREAELAALTAQFDVLGTALARDYARGDLAHWMGERP